MTEPARIYGVMAEFVAPDALVAATRDARAAGFDVDAFAPFPVSGLAEAAGVTRTRVPAVMFLGGLLGGAGGYFLQWFANVVSYPLNIGGKPLHSWPSFIPVTFEMTVLGAAVAGFVGVFVMNRLPEPYHPVFDAPGFARASVDRFFLLLRAHDAGRADAARAFLTDRQPASVSLVAAPAAFEETERR